MIRRGFAVLFGCAVALSWVMPLCAAVSAPKAAHACCPDPAAPKDAGAACCCRPVDSGAPHSQSVMEPSLDALLPVVTRPGDSVRVVGRVLYESFPKPLDASPPVPTGLSPPASA